MGSLSARVLVALLMAGACTRVPRDAGRQSLRGTLGLSSPAFADGASIPSRYAYEHCGEGATNRSPPLSFRGVTAATRSLVLIVDDPDAPRGAFVHWVVYDLPPARSGLPEGVSPGSAGFLQGRSGFGSNGWGGPCPPSGEHRYVFHLYALDTASLGLSAGASADEVRARMQDHVVAEATWMGRYRQNR